MTLYDVNSPQFKKFLVKSTAGAQPRPAPGPKATTKQPPQQKARPSSA
jgi:hypothetical protein